MPRPELISAATRRVFREMAVDTYVAQIAGMWEDEGFQQGPANDLSGARRSLYQSYLDTVDWSDPDNVRRALRVFEEQLRQTEPQYRVDAIRKLGRDGIEVDDEGGISSPHQDPLRPGLLSNLSDASAIYAGLDRITRALSAGDAALVIGSAKEVIESTAKVVLRQLGEPFSPKDDLPALVSKAQKRLGLDPKSAVSGPDGSDAVRKILGGAQSVAIGLAELRNRGFGTGHGPATAPVGLGPRHAHLAVNSAQLWCELILETLEDPRAPWRSRQPSSASGGEPGTSGDA